MTVGDPGQTAFERLSEAVGSGRFGWGEPLVVTALAAELGLSPTPVREAMARLAGEGLIDYRPGRGYAAPSLTAGDVADLYALHEILCTSALDDLCGASTGDGTPSGDEAFFAWLAERIGNRAVAGTLLRTGRRLRPVRAVEADIPGLTPLAAQDIQTAISVGDGPRARLGLSAYHQSRYSNADLISRRLRCHWKV